MKSLRLGLIAATLLCLPLSAFANPINPVTYGSLTGLGLVTFDDVAGGGAPGTNYDGILASGGEHFAERFVGQTLSASAEFDVLTNALPLPTPLALQPHTGGSGQNLVVLDNGGTNVMAGLGNLGFFGADPFSAIGEGSFALLFTNDQSQFGFQLVGGESDPGTGVTIDFFRRDGSLIDRVVVLNLSAFSYGFSREGGVQDIAGISIFTDDPGGIGFDNLKFDVPADATTVPEPATLSLVGVAGLFLLRRRMKRSA